MPSFNIPHVAQNDAITSDNIQNICSFEIFIYSEYLLCSLSFLLIFLNMPIWSRLWCNSSRFLRQVYKWSDCEEWHFIEMTITLFEQSNYIRGPSNKQLRYKTFCQRQTQNKNCIIFIPRQWGIRVAEIILFFLSLFFSWSFWRVLPSA